MDWLTATLIGAFIIALAEVIRLRLRHTKLLSREALVAARQAIIQERTDLESAKTKQAFELGMLEGVRRASKERDQDESYQLGFEKGILEGRRLAESDFHIETWTEVKKNQGYFFTSAEIHACYQLIYKGIPIGAPQRHIIEQSESVDREALDSMVNKVLGESSLGPATTLRGIRIVNRQDNEPKKIAAGK